jgi:phospholipase C
MPAQIKHLVVLMMENRSLDHMLGFMQSKDYLIEGLDGTELNRDSTGEPVRVNDQARYSGDLGIDPRHDFQDVMEQMFGTYPPAAGQQADMSGFVRNYERYTGGPAGATAVMNCFASTNLAILATLARSYAVCDHWFSSVPGPTLANRLYAHAGTTRGRLDSLSPDFLGGFRTVYEVLFNLNPPVSSAIFYEDWTAALSFEGLLLHNQARFFAEYSRFGELCRQNKLPSYCFIEPRYHTQTVGSSLPANDQHPDHDVAAGEGFIHSVYDDLRSNDDVWKTSILVIVYDEHGGLFDHVPPPGHNTVPAVPIACSPDSISCPAPPFDFTQLGPRVPAVVISPYITPGKIDPTIYDHTSLIATAMKLFAGNAWPSDALGKRAQVANTFDSLLDLNAAPRMEQPNFAAAQNQSTAAVAAVTPAPPAPLSALQHVAVQHAAELESRLPPELKTRTDPSQIHDEHSAGVYVSKVAAALSGQGKGGPSNVNH